MDVAAYSSSDGLEWEGEAGGEGEVGVAAFEHGLAEDGEAGVELVGGLPAVEVEGDGFREVGEAAVEEEFGGGDIFGGDGDGV